MVHRHPLCSLVRVILWILPNGPLTLILLLGNLISILLGLWSDCAIPAIASYRPWIKSWAHRASKGNLWHTCAILSLPEIQNPRKRPQISVWLFPPRSFLWAIQTRCSVPASSRPHVLCQSTDHSCFLTNYAVSGWELCPSAHRCSPSTSLRSEHHLRD